MRIRSAIPEDESFVRELAGEVFSPYGDYRPLLPKWFRVPGVLTFISESNACPRARLMLAFFNEGGALVGDVLALAVRPEFQRQGIGRTLLQHAFLTCEQVTERTPVRAVRLSVAASNAPARALFASAGFVELAGDFGTYEGGQKALHMERAVAPSDGVPRDS